MKRAFFDDTFAGIHQLAFFDYAMMVPYFLVLLFVANLFALHGPYLWLLCLQSAWYMLASAGTLFSQRASMRMIPQVMTTSEEGNSL